MTTDIELILKFSYLKDCRPTGSRYICFPPVLDTDEDFICYTKDYDKLKEELEGAGYKCDSEDYEDVAEDFYSWKNEDKINLIITTKKDFFDRWAVATELAKQMNLLEKSKRIALFDKILYGVDQIAF